MQKIYRLSAICLMCSLVLLGCDEAGPDDGADVTGPDRVNNDQMDEGVDEAYMPNIETWLEHDTPEPDFAERAADPDFQAKLKAVEAEIGHSAAESEHIPGLFLISANHSIAEWNINEWNDRFYNEGIYVFRVENNYDLFGKLDTIGVLPTTDQFEVIRAVGTYGANYGISNAYIIKYLRELHAEHPIIITGVAFDSIEGRFRRPPGRDMELAKGMYEFCPDIVDMGASDVETLADEIAKGTFYFWWD